MNIDTLNAYCGPVLVTGLPLFQGRLHNIHRGFTSWNPALSGLQPWLLQSDQDVPCSVGLHPTLGVEKPGLVCSEPLRGTDVWGADCYFHPLSTSNPLNFDLKSRGTTR